MTNLHIMCVEFSGEFLQNQTNTSFKGKQIKT